MADLGKALTSASVLFEYLDSKSEIDTIADKADSTKIKSNEIKGKIEFIDVSF